MQRLFNEIGDPLRVAAFNKAITSLDQHRFDWNNHYVATTEPGHKVDVRLAGIAGEQFMARTKTAILIGQSRDLPEPRPERGQEFTRLKSALKRRAINLRGKPRLFVRMRSSHW